MPTESDFKGLWEWLFPKYYTPNIVRIVGPRAEQVGITDPDKSIWYQLPFNSRTPQEISPDLTRQEGNQSFGNYDILDSGGIAVPTSWQTLFRRANHPMKLESLVRDVRESHCLPLIFNYPWAVEERIRQVGEDIFRKSPGFGNYGLANWGEMTYKETKEIGRSKEAQALGIETLDWKLLRVLSNGQTEELIKVTPVSELKAKGGGTDAFLIYMGPSVYYSGNGPRRKQYLSIGGRGASTQVANNLFGGLKRAQTTPDPTSPIPIDYWAIEGIEDLAKVIWTYIDGRTMPYQGIVLGAVTYLDGGKAWKVGDILDISFVRFEDTKVNAVSSIGVLDINLYKVSPYKT